jgi:hypothetical protein
MQRLGKNIGGYKGETIDIHAVLRDAEQAAAAAGWTAQPIRVAEGFQLPAFQRGSNPGRKRIYLSAGIHGDEPAGPLAVRELLRQNLWPADVAIWLCACLNPAGFRLNQRENEAGMDLNRDYRHLRTDAVRAHVAWLQRAPSFDVSLCLHEDWEAHGFYLYELNPEGRPSLARKIIACVAQVCPIDPSPIIEGREARAGIISPSLDPNSRPEWPEAFYLIQNKTRLSYTFEAPSDFPLPTRVAALVAGLRAVLESI